MKVLCVIDMQNDFIDGALGTKEAVAIVDKVKEKIALYRKNGEELFSPEILTVRIILTRLREKSFLFHTV